jgi:N-acetylmuramoyl-L-alanine amidase
MTKKVYWDKGHGGIDPGGNGNGLKEKDLVSKIVNYADAFLMDNYTGVETKMSRKGDETLSLSQRTDDANAWGADLLISVHTNAGGGKGFESFIYNRSVGSSTIAFQNVLHGEIIASMRKFGAITDRGKKRANFHMVRESKMIAVLTENLFIDTSDSSLLKNEAFLKAVGEAHARGVAKFLGLPSKPKPSQPKELYRVQVGAFGEKANAERLAADLKSKGFPVYIVKEKV